jgi:hypothetical protein
MTESGVITGHSAVSASRLLRPDKRTLLAGFRTTASGQSRPSVAGRNRETPVHLI